MLCSDRPQSLDHERLRTALETANLPSLLMVLLQLSGDRQWIEDPFRPTRPRGLDQHRDGGFDHALQDRIRSAALDAVTRWANGHDPAIPHPDADLLVEMLEACSGEPVPREYAEMAGHDMALRPGTSRPAFRHPLRVVVIGAGVSGMLAAHRLRQAGADVTVLEKNDDVGGTWLENRYPGCGVDTPSHLYALSILPRHWSAHFAKRDEVLDYMRQIARDLDVTDCVEFGVTVASATYVESDSGWIIDYHDRFGTKHELRTDVVVTAVGQLNQPQIPDLPGRDQFASTTFHSAAWPEGLDVTGKRVAVIGSGATAMQIVPAICQTAAHVTVFQRSPGWIAPHPDYFTPIGDDENWLLATVPFYHQWLRTRLGWTFNDRVHPSLQIDPTWDGQGESISELNDVYRQHFTAYLEAELADRPDLIAKTTPDYPPFGKRILIDNGWFAALKRPDVTLVTDRILEITEQALTTTSGEQHAADVIVYATGFEATRPLHHIDIRGRDGQKLRDIWDDDDPRAYLGMATPGFPNFFCLYGPNTNLGHGGSYPTMAECQVEFLIDLLTRTAGADAATVECSNDAWKRYATAMDEAHEHMVWSHRGMATWYRNSRGRVVANFPGRVVDYWTMTRNANLDEFIITPDHRHDTSSSTSLESVSQ